MAAGGDLPDRASRELPLLRDTAIAYHCRGGHKFQFSLGDIQCAAIAACTALDKGRR
jgi:hypothetical protein